MTVRRQGAANGFFNIENMKPEAVFLPEVPVEKRMSRDELNAITELYLDYLEGKKRGPDVPFDEAASATKMAKSRPMGCPLSTRSRHSRSSKRDHDDPGRNGQSTGENLGLSASA